MKKLTISIGKHKAVIRFKNIPLKDFTKLRWRLVEQNIAEITTDCFEQIESSKNLAQNQTKYKQHLNGKTEE
ncbi:hypothetical protein [Thalassotalea sp. PP2-459]|uniref:hypothetical protein n=1 Tax=Thalassotalea sp. PP2-459 TaxID=1742724 RepID=UPI0009455514|nr:hypothetical protein [Thalassotalea sp. PP2-459]OKY24967.1 hypothetical protein BI291_04420 [Thalassotalea sp. PP2-459]